jgi:hypothetical protein
VSGYAGELVDGALSAIDRVHDDGVLPSVPVKASLRSGYGYFLPAEAEDGSLSAVEIGVRRTGPWRSLTTAHEVGHLLDLEAIGEKGNYATLTDAGMKQVLAAAEKTEAVKALRQKLAETTSEEVAKHLRYLLMPQEIWARAYAQFIAEEAGSKMLQGELAAALEGEKFRQWAREDFGQVSAAIHKLFQELGWL